MYTIKEYNISHYGQWNEFVAKSKNGTFLFHRDFMEYHSDRFQDFSLLIFDGNTLIAVLPANRVENVLHSHQGLTYGGLVLIANIGAEKVELIFNSIQNFLKEKGIDVLKIKQPVSIYHKEPAFEMDYVLFKNAAKLYRRDMNLAIDFLKPLNISKSKLKHFRRISTLGLDIRKDNNFDNFWDKVLIPRLSERYNTKPVHTKEEIQLLHSRFPENIIQYNVYSNDSIIAGITLFYFGNVVKSQYGATTAEGEKLRALDYLFINLINAFRDKVHYFDMGTVNENEGMAYNSGLLKQKEELGCSVYAQDFYEVETANFIRLGNVLI